jgi:hypothetical protein
VRSRRHFIRPSEGAEGCSPQVMPAAGVKWASTVFEEGAAPGKLCEMSDRLAHHHRSLLQILKLLLKLDHTLRYIMRLESHLELIPVDAFGFFMSFCISILPIRCRAYKLV